MTTVGPQHVLRPKTAMTIMKNVVDKALELKPTDVVFHHFSVGGYLFGQMLRTLQREDMVSLRSKKLFLTSVLLYWCCLTLCGVVH